MTSLECDVDSKRSRVFFSAFGLGEPGDPLPQSVEMIGFDPVSGVFNYYETAGDQGRIDFFGTSKDMLEGPGEGEDRRCAPATPAEGSS